MRCAASQDLGFRESSGFRVWGSGIWGLECEVQGSGVKVVNVSGIGFGAWSLWREFFGDCECVQSLTATGSST